LTTTWTTGGHAQSASQRCSNAGATSVALVVIGRHIRLDYEPVKDSGEKCGDLLKRFQSRSIGRLAPFTILADGRALEGVVPNGSPRLSATSGARHY